MIGDFIHSKFDSPQDKKGKGSKKKNSFSTNENDREPTIRKRDVNKGSNSKQTEGKLEKKTSLIRDQIKNKLHTFIGHLEHVPDFLRDNDFIHTGYRINFSTPKKVLKSLFMLHNESMNVWTHLGGAIILIIICVFLCFSVNSLDTQNLKQFVKTEVGELFEPIYTRLPDFTQLEQGLSDRLSQTKNDITKFGESTIINLENNLVSISQEIESVKDNINPEAIGRLLTNLKGKLEDLPSNLASISQGFDTAKLEKTSEDLKRKLGELQTELLNDIDSAKFDWIDIYRYIRPDYNNSHTLRDGHHVMPLSRWPIIVFLFSAVFCLLCSAIFHLFYCLSESANQILLRLDYAGISILITGSCFPPFVYGFYCQPFFSKFYLSIIAVTSIIVFFVSLTDIIHTQEYRKVKSLMYGGLGVFAALPSIHLTYLAITMSNTNDNLDFNPSLPYYLAMGVSYLGGLVIYSTKCPERFSPGKFDIFGHSHQIWHVCVLLGIILTYIGAFDNYYTRMKIPCIGCDL